MTKIDFTSPVVVHQYQSHIFYDVENGSDTDKTENLFFKLKHSDNLKVEANSGGACWDPYFEITGTNLKEVTNFTNKAIRILKRFNCVTRIYN